MRWQNLGLKSHMHSELQVQSHFLFTFDRGRLYLLFPAVVSLSPYPLLYPHSFFTSLLPSLPPAPSSSHRALDTVICWACSPWDSPRLVYTAFILFHFQTNGVTFYGNRSGSHLVKNNSRVKAQPIKPCCMSVRT